MEGQGAASNRGLLKRWNAYVGQAFRPVLFAMYYYPFQSSRAATNFPVPSLRRAAMWGRLVTCGGLVIRLPAARTIPGTRLHCLRLAAMQGRLSTCGGLVIRLPAAITMPGPPCTVCGVPLRGAGVPLRVAPLPLYVTWIFSRNDEPFTQKTDPAADETRGRRCFQIGGAT